MSGLHGRPTGEELLEAVREFLTDVLAPGVDPALRFHLRVAANALDIVGREIQLGGDQAREHEERLRGLGYADDRELATAIREGWVRDDQRAAVRAAVAADVQARLAVANPRYLETP